MSRAAHRDTCWRLDDRGDKLVYTRVTVSITKDDLALLLESLRDAPEGSTHRLVLGHNDEHPAVDVHLADPDLMCDCADTEQPHHLWLTQGELLEDGWVGLFVQAFMSRMGRTSGKNFEQSLRHCFGALSLPGRLMPSTHDPLYRSDDQ